MWFTEPLLGASRLRWTTKMGNVHYYKGTRQAFVPGEGRRTGLPGRHLIRGKGKFKVDDRLVRYYVSPGAEALANTDLKPYVHRTEMVPKLTYLGTLDEVIAAQLAARERRRSRHSGNLEPKQRQALIAEQRREMWNSMAEQFPAELPEEYASDHDSEVEGEVKDAAREEAKQDSTVDTMQ